MLLAVLTLSLAQSPAVPPAAKAAKPSTFPPYSGKTLIAHRGASGLAPEHTQAAYELALAHQSAFVEPDLQVTKDGHLVCLHDGTLERTTDVAKVFPDRARATFGIKRFPVGDFTLAEIKRLDAGAWFGPAFVGQRVPTFREMLRLVRGKAGVFPETKSPESQGGRDMEALVLADLKAEGLDRPGADPRTPVVIQSFSQASLERLRKHGTALPLVWLATRDNDELKPEGLKRLARFVQGIGPTKWLVERRPELVRDAHAAGLSVTCWTFAARSPGKHKDVTAEMRHFLDVLGIDALFTDNPERFPR